MTVAVAEPARLPRTLIIDFYDSYTLNLLTLFAPYPDELVRRQVVVVRFDTYSWDEFVADVLPHFEAIILSPGPGTPAKEADFGWAAQLVRLCPVPILGVCLGMQGIATALGAEVRFAGRIEHGQRVAVASSGGGVFAGADPEAGKWVVYNSLVVSRETLPSELKVDAWLESDPSQIMGLSHVSKPLWGVQFHPESIHSDLGQLVLQNFLRLAALEPARSLPNAAIPDLILAASATARHEAEPAVLSASPKRFKLEIRRFHAGNGLGAQRVFETLVQGKTPGDFWLDSAMKNNHDASPSYSYLGSRAHTLTYSTETGLALLNTGKPAKPLACDAPFFDGLNALQQALAAQTAFPTAEGGPDWKAGWVGWMGYGLKSETLPGYGTRKGKERQLGERPDAPDACLSFVRTVLALDHTTSDWLAIGLVEMGSVGQQQGLDGGLGAVLEAEGVRWASTEAEWEMYLGECEAALAQLEAESRPSQRPAPTSLPAFVPEFSGADYIDRIGTARDLIHSGESYELTLTTQFRSTLPADRTPYDLYLTLRASNPAPYSTFINLPELDVAVVSSSPERFIKLGKDGTVEMKPIKGTVARVKGDPVSDEAVKNALQNDRKEIAENLMIVDLIRADLLSFCRPSSVKVPKLIQVESFDHVHQLVTTVVGELGVGVGSFEAIGRCFPPGSMTGAPKLRSVQILDGLEDERERGIYSGAMGYLSLDGAADFNVVIRTIIVQGQELTIGAGGAITWLSDAHSEWEEVGVKVGSVLKGFETTVDL